MTLSVRQGEGLGFAPVLSLELLYESDDLQSSSD